MCSSDLVIIGDLATCRRKIEKYRDVGFDRLMCLMQFGHLGHDQVMASIRRVGEELIPIFDPEVAPVGAADPTTRVSSP